MLNKIFHSLAWVPNYLVNYIDRQIRYGINKNYPLHVFFCICDHFEPYWNKANSKIAEARIKTWVDKYPKICDKYLDSDNHKLKYTFFYPEEEYNDKDMRILAELCHSGYGEVEIHLHHDNDTSKKFEKKILEYKAQLFEKHGLLSLNRETGEISYGFIHGNWALDNSRPDGRMCGVNNELEILERTGCYADFTMPSAPDVTQIKKVNSIYSAVDDPLKPKSHEIGHDLKVNKEYKGLLLVQGPLSLNWKNKTKGIFPKIENGGLMLSNPPSANRINSWINQRIHVKGFKQGIFVKIYTHGTQEQNIKMLFENNGLEFLLSYLSELGKESSLYKIHFTSSREMTNIIHAIIDGHKTNFNQKRNYKFQNQNI